MQCPILLSPRLGVAAGGEGQLKGKVLTSIMKKIQLNDGSMGKELFELDCIILALFSFASLTQRSATVSLLQLFRKKINVSIIS